jgi:hypothetical protein
MYVSRYDVLLEHRDRLSFLYIVGRMLIFCQGQSVVSFACYMQYDIICFAYQSMLRAISMYFSGQRVLLCDSQNLTVILLTPFIAE